MQDLDAGKKELTEEIQTLRSRVSKLEQVGSKLTNPGNVDDPLDNAWREWETTFDAIKDSVILTDSDFKIIQANLATSRLFDKPLDEIIGKTCWKLIHGTDDPPKNCPLKKTKDTKTHQEIELYLSEKDIWVEASVSPILDQEGKVNGVIHILRDITERKKAQEAMRESEQKFRTIFDNTSDGMFLFDLEAKKFSMCNKAWLQMLGYTQEEFMNLAIEDLHLKEDLPFIYLQIGEFAKGRNGIRNDIRFKRKDRSIFFTDLSPDLVTLGGKRHILVAVKDITERKRSEELLRKEKDRAQKYLDIAGVMLVAIDTEQRVGLINKKGCEILGYNEDEIVAKNWFDNFLPEKNREEVRAVFEKILRGELNSLEYYENPILTKNGEERLIAWCNTALRDDKGKVIAALGSGEDITERKKAEEALRENEEKYRDLFENAREAILTLDLKGNITGVNKLVEEYGFKREELIGRSHFDFIAEKSRSEAFKEFERLTQGTPVEGEVEVITLKGNRIVEYRNNPICRGGQIVGIQEILIDVTERKKAEQQLLQDQMQLKSLASQLTLAEERERRRLAGELHDRISQSLVISKIKLEALRKSGYGKKLDKALDDVCNLLGQTIQDTRTLTFDLGNPILYELGFETAVSHWLTEQIQNKYKIETEFEDDGHHKPLDDDVRTLLFRDVRELLINVVKHAKASKVKVSIAKIDDQIRVSVEDNGKGFDAGKIASIPANGYGLFSIRHRLEQLGGHLEIESTRGRGCKVTMTAPLKLKGDNNGRNREISQGNGN